MYPTPPPHPNQPEPTPHYTQPTPPPTAFPLPPHLPPQPGIDPLWLERTRQRNMWLWALIAFAVVGSIGYWAYESAGIIALFLVLFFLAFVAFAILIVRALVRVGNKPQPVQPIMINYPTAPAQPGWYRDAQGVTRWHDGTNWTAYTHPPQP
ncbi:DUF2510 domain-containing protein [Nocardia cyriacigeorgica]|uniref:DUF2510 domain-containing protein n=1 Tax=Nocardia cyriacigeorgica TaxID=135487 RepID=UPI0018948555|nr:DUF2510 domain-containing protein [Nocardia cyriacigeorgica]MBF6094958.1 DUF2510 domain-containing protein [Nocardia cyriacigeorgica]